MGGAAILCTVLPSVAVYYHWLPAMLIKPVVAPGGHITFAPQEGVGEVTIHPTDSTGQPISGGSYTLISKDRLAQDIAGILDEAITNIDDVSRRDEKNPLISRSLRKLTTSANGYLNQLAALRNKTKDPDEASAIEHVADNANQIIEVGNKLPPPTPESGKKKKKP